MAVYEQFTNCGGCTRAVRKPAAAPASVCRHVPVSWSTENLCRASSSSAGQLLHDLDYYILAFSAETSAIIKRDRRNDGETDVKQFTNSLRTFAKSWRTVQHNEQEFGKQSLRRSLRTVYEQFAKLRTLIFIQCSTFCKQNRVYAGSCKLRLCKQ